MDFEFLNDYLVLVIVGICLCVGYIIKTSLDFIPNKMIPLIMMILGMVINILMNMDVSAEIVLEGMISGLSSTGLYEGFKNYINKKDIEDKKDSQNK